ncbi:putative porin [Actimicrobium sp. GrIS 1.19]|uniref:porin n=1 Tax=Actimicrobium sp. GrIS 1.19 TaxID=3071708 RepID=UPI002DFDA777|nr:putative porin [Actimicrobium sp. GrIS 1.19]
MKYSTLAVLLIGAASGTAMAQTNVTVYGIADVGLVAERGSAAGSVSKLTSGIASGSRLGFRGTEDLGGGLAANFLLETGIAIDAGGFNQSNTAFGRQAFVGLSGGFGALTLGRQYTPQYLTLVLADPFGTGLAGDAANIMPNTGDAASRMNNTIKYASPNLQGFTGEVAYGFGEVAGSTKAARQYGAAIGYANGPIAVRLGYHNRNNDTATVTNTSAAKNTLLALTYDLSVVKLHLGYGVDKGTNSSILRNTGNPYGSAVAPIASTDSRDLLLGVTVPFGVHTLLGSYIRKDDKTGNNRDANQWAIGYRYALSKRTDLYSSYARIKNDNGAGYTVGSAIEAGSGDKAFNVGVRHTF